MSQCVPSWDLEDPPNTSPRLLPSSSPPHPQLLLPMADYDEVVELTWENGHLSAHSLVKPVARYSASTAGTLESVVDQANMLRQPSTGSTGPVSAEAVDALVATRRSLQCDDLASGIECDGRKRARVSPGSGGGSRDSITAGCGTTDTDFGFGVSRLPDTENTSFGSGGVGGGGGSKATMDDHYSACHSRRSLSQMEAGGDEDEKATDGGTMRSTISTKRTRAAAVHNQSERKRRDKINQRIRTLQKLVPNSSKTDKASMLDEVIEYLKQLQAQVQMISRMSSIPTLPMTMPMGMQQFQMTMMAQMAQIAQMVKMGMTMGFMPDIGHMAATPSSLVRPNFGPVAAAAVPSVLQPQFLPMVGGGSSWDHPLVAEKKQQSNDAAVVMHDSFPTFVACPTQQPMTLDAYHRMAAVYQQMFQQNQASNPK